MRNIFLLLLLLTISTTCTLRAQEGLTANPHFTDINVCTEHNAKCAPEGWLTASTSNPTYKNGAVGITVFNSSKRNVRQYLQSELLETMQTGKMYTITLRMKAGNCLLQSLGIKFNNQWTCLEKEALIEKQDVDLAPLLEEQPRRKQKKWMDIEYVYTAKGGERFILIGCFLPERRLEKDFVKKSTPYQNYYYFFDKIDIQPVSQDSLPVEALEVKNHLYNFNYRHTFCRYIPYQTVNKDTAKKNTIEQHQPELKVQHITLEGVLFSFNDHRLNKKIETKLLDAFEAIEKDAVQKIEIIGHTDTIGDESFNVQLSKKRAKAVKSFLLDIGFNESIVNATGKGSSEPVAENNTKEGRAKNRRVAIVISYR